MKNFLLNKFSPLTSTSNNKFNLIQFYSTKKDKKLDLKNQKQPYHLVKKSPWPIFISFALMTTAFGTVIMFNFKHLYLMVASMITLFICMYQWWRDVIREGTFQGFHSIVVSKGIKKGMIAFIISEILFFTAFFWSYINAFLAPSVEVGNKWPPSGIESIMVNPFQLPLLNTILLVSSGVFLSVSHFALLKMNHKKCLNWLLLSISFGILFSMIQGYEYYHCSFTITDSTYGTAFFMLTGFHGCHVFVGIMLLTATFFRMKNNHFSDFSHLLFEVSAWYWHFVDVIWLFLFLLIYWWPY